MLYSLKNANNQAAKSRKAVLLVTLFLSSLFLSLIPAVSASHITQYAVQRDPSYISIGDLDCDGHNDIFDISRLTKLSLDKVLSEVKLMIEKGLLFDNHSI